MTASADLRQGTPATRVYQVIIGMALLAGAELSGGNGDSEAERRPHYAS